MKFIIYSFIILLLFSCGKKEEKIIAQVNDDKLTFNELRANFSDKNWNNKAEKDEFIQNWIELCLLSQEADRRDLSETDLIKFKVETAGRKIKSNSLIAQVFSNLQISEKQMFEYYRLHKSDYQKEIKEYKIQRIFIKEEEKLNIVLDELEKGSKFADTAKKYSEEKIGENGGYAGFLSAQKLGETIWSKFKNLRKWQYTSIKLDNGYYYIIRFYDSRFVTEEKTFDEVKDEIREIVLKNQKEQVYKNLIEELKIKSEISISL